MATSDEHTKQYLPSVLRRKLVYDGIRQQIELVHLRWIIMTKIFMKMHSFAVYQKTSHCLNISLLIVGWLVCIVCMCLFEFSIIIYLCLFSRQPEEYDRLVAGEQGLQVELVLELLYIIVIIHDAVHYRLSMQVCDDSIYRNIVFDIDISYRRNNIELIFDISRYFSSS